MVKICRRKYVFRDNFLILGLQGLMVDPIVLTGPKLIANCDIKKAFDTFQYINNNIRMGPSENEHLAPRIGPYRAIVHAIGFKTDKSLLQF